MSKIIFCVSLLVSLAAGVAQNEKFTSFSEKLLSNLVKTNAAVAYSQTGEISDKANFFNLTGPLYSVKVNAADFTSPLKVWGDGTESKFPPFLEHLLQRVQFYYSIFKYDDLSRGTTTSSYNEVTDELELSTSSAVKSVGEIVSTRATATTTMKPVLKQENSSVKVPQSEQSTEESVATKSATTKVRKRITFVPVYFDRTTEPAIAIQLVV
jgi:hypothetical protein